MHYHRFPFCAAALFAILLLTACNNQSAESTKNDNDTVNVSSTVKKDTGTTFVQAPETIKSCFSNDGLKYNMVITLFISGDTVTGNVSSTELDSGKEEKTTFTGTADGNKLTIAFSGKPPVVGAASEWTNKPWMIENTAGVEKLLITFNAKNYETNQWQEMVYEFLPCSK